MASNVGLHFSPDGEDLLPLLVAEPHGSLVAGTDGSQVLCTAVASPQRVAAKLTRGFYSPSS